MPLFKSKYNNLSDEQLMTLLRHGRNGALEEIYKRYNSRLLYYFYRMLARDEQKAQDFLQDIFLKLIEKSSHFREENQFSTWIYTLAHNMCKNDYRNKNNRSRIEAENPEAFSSIFKDDSDTSESKIDEMFFAKAVQNELNKLDDDHRSTFLLRYQENLSIKEIQEIMKCPEGTVKSRLFYTGRKLADKLREFNPVQ